MIEEVNLADVCDIIAGQSPPSSTYNQEGNGTPFFQGKADFGETYPTVRYWCDSPKKMSEPDDILFSVRAPVGPTNINNINACIGRGLAAIRCIEIERNYLLHYLRGNEEKISSLGSGSTFKAITIGTLKELKIPLPSLDQQKKIAAILDAADAYRQKTKALIEKYDELTQSLFLDMFGDPLGNPKGWEKRTLNDVCIKITDGEHGTVKRLDSGKLYLMARNVRHDSLEMDEVSYISQEDHERIYKRCNPEAGDLLLVCVGATIGRCCLVPFNFEDFSLARSVALIKPNNKLNSLFLLYHFKDLHFQNKIQNSRNISAQAGLYTGQIKKLKVILPPIELQNQFAERVKAIEEQKVQAQASLAQAEDLFNSLLQRAFKGELTS